MDTFHGARQPNVKHLKVIIIIIIIIIIIMIIIIVIKINNK